LAFGVCEDYPDGDWFNGEWRRCLRCSIPVNLLSPRAGKAYNAPVNVTRRELRSSHPKKPHASCFDIAERPLDSASAACGWRRPGWSRPSSWPITIIGLPWARAAFNIAAYTLLPFGQKAVRRDSLTGQPISAPDRSA
jgi:hypothetical protein